MGYILTITESDTLRLLDKIKGFNGDESFNTHFRRIITAYTDVDVKQDAWCYVLSDVVLESFEQIEQVEFGLWDEKDEKQINLLEKIGESL